MKSISRLAGAVATGAVAATMLVASPATAAPGDTTISFAPVAVLNEGSCIDHAFNYNVELPAGTTSWTVTFVLMGPDGASHDRQSLGTFAGSPSAGADALPAVLDVRAARHLHDPVHDRLQGGHRADGLRVPRCPRARSRRCATPSHGSP